MIVAAWIGIVFLAVTMLWSVARKRGEQEEQTIPAPMRCAVESCDWEANRRRLRFHRSEGFSDYIRRSFGAAPRYRIVEDVWGMPTWCETHYAQAVEEMRLQLAIHEHSRVEHIRDAERKLSRFERELSETLKRFNT